MDRVVKGDRFQLKWEQLPSLPDPEGYAGMYAGACGGGLLVAGGANFPEKPLWEGGKKCWTDKVYFLKEGETAWKEVGRLPMPLAYGAGVSTPEGVMIMGGTTPEGVRSECYLLRVEGGCVVCEQLPELPVGLTGHSAVLCGDKVYVVGGSSLPGEQDALNRLFIYSLSAREWTEGPSLCGRGRFLHQMAHDDGRIYVLGGIGLAANEQGKPCRDMLREAWRYSEQTGWERLADLPRFCAAAPTPAPVWGGRIFLLGGDDASRAGIPPQEHPGFHRVSLAYDTRRDCWEEAPAPAVGRAVLPCVPNGKRAVIVNGERKPGKRSNEVWAIDWEGGEA